MWGRNGLPLGLPDFLAQPISAELFFVTWYRIFMVIVVIVVVARTVPFPALHACRRAHPAGTLDLETVASLGVNISFLRTFNFASAACWPA